MDYPDKSYYDILGVPGNASEAQIKAAYRTQIKFFHPDVFQGSPEVAEEKSKELNEAYETLSDPMRRVEYDLWLRQRQDEETARADRQAGQQERPRAEQERPHEERRKARESHVPGQRKSRWRTAAVAVLGALLMLAAVLELVQIQRLQGKIDMLTADLELANSEVRDAERKNDVLYQELKGLHAKTGYYWEKEHDVGPLFRINADEELKEYMDFLSDKYGF